MKTIKFRAWATYTKEWMDVKYFNVRMDTGELQNNKCAGIIGGIKLMQFTGLKDKNGKEIYEGDIIKDEKSDGIANGVVEFGEGTYDSGFYSYQGYYVKYPKTYFDGDKYNRYENRFETDATGGYLFGCEVIGNIYENPELLK